MTDCREREGDKPDKEGETSYLERETSHEKEWRQAMRGIETRQIERETTMRGRKTSHDMEGYKPRERYNSRQGGKQSMRGRETSQERMRNKL